MSAVKFASPSENHGKCMMYDESSRPMKTTRAQQKLMNWNNGAVNEIAHA
jgi:hypothetical protein